MNNILAVLITSAVIPLFLDPCLLWGNQSVFFLYDPGLSEIHLSATSISQFRCCSLQKQHVLPDVKESVLRSLVDSRLVSNSTNKQQRSHFPSNKPSVRELNHVYLSHCRAHSSLWSKPRLKRGSLPKIQAGHPKQLHASHWVRRN